VNEHKTNPFRVTMISTLCPPPILIICLPIRQTVCLSFRPPVRPFALPFAGTSIGLVCPSGCQSVLPFVSMSVCPSVCLSVCLSACVGWSAYVLMLVYISENNHHKDECRRTDRQTDRPPCEPKAILIWGSDAVQKLTPQGFAISKQNWGKYIKNVYVRSSALLKEEQ